MPGSIFRKNPPQGQGQQQPQQGYGAPALSSLAPRRTVSRDRHAEISKRAADRRDANFERRMWEKSLLARNNQNFGGGGGMAQPFVGGVRGASPGRDRVDTRVIGGRRSFGHGGSAGHMYDQGKEKFTNRAGQMKRTGARTGGSKTYNAGGRQTNIARASHQAFGDAGPVMIHQARGRMKSSGQRKRERADRAARRGGGGTGRSSRADRGLDHFAAETGRVRENRDRENHANANKRAQADARRRSRNGQSRQPSRGDDNSAFASRFRVDRAREAKSQAASRDWRKRNPGRARQQEVKSYTAQRNFQHQFRGTF